MNGDSLARADAAGEVKAAGAAAAAPADTWTLTQALILSRQTVMPRRLAEPGPDAAQLHDLLTLAAAAPDHGQLTPWRYVVIAPTARTRLAEVFALALTDRDPQASEEQLHHAREKAHRAPLLMVVVACLGPRDPDIPALERMVSIGAAVQNLLLGAHALGFGTGLTSGKAMASSRLHALLALTDTEVPVCCINIGTVARHKPRQSKRPTPASFTTVLGDSSDDGIEGQV